MQRDVREYPFKTTAGKWLEEGRHTCKVRMPEQLFEQIKAEALLREWSFARMVRHLCEASIDGIE